MFRLIFNRVVFIARVSVFIVYTVSMGTRMVGNSELVESDVMADEVQSYRLTIAGQLFGLMRMSLAF